MENTSPTLQAICVLLFILACLSLNAQSELQTGGNPWAETAEVLFNISDTVRPKTADCFGFSDPQPDPVEWKIYTVPKLKWYDFSTYRFKGDGKRAVWVGYALAGILHGGREAYHAESTVFEKRFNAAPLSFWGSGQWKRQYFNRDPENQAHKPEIWNSVRDYWHFSHTASSTLWVSGAFVLGYSKQPLKYRLLDAAIAGIITSAFASTTYELLR